MWMPPVFARGKRKGDGSSSWDAISCEKADCWWYRLMASLRKNTCRRRNCTWREPPQKGYGLHCGMLESLRKRRICVGFICWEI